MKESRRIQFSQQIDTKRAIKNDWRHACRDPADTTFHSGPIKMVNVFSQTTAIK